MVKTSLAHFAHPEPENRRSELAHPSEPAGANDALRIDRPAEEELLAACEYALEWFRSWDEHADHELNFGGEYAVMKRLRHAVRLAREEGWP